MYIFYIRKVSLCNFIKIYSSRILFRYKNVIQTGGLATQACVVTWIESTWRGIRELCLLGVCILVNAFATHFMRNRLVNIFSRQGHSSHNPLSAVPRAMRIAQFPFALSVISLRSRPLCLDLTLRYVASRRDSIFNSFP